MTRYVAFLRGINVGGRTVPMTRLCAIFESLRFKDVASFIASGNIVFTTGSIDLEALHARIEKALHKDLGYEVRVFLRSDAEVAAIAAYRPFDDATMASHPTLNIGLLREPLTKAARTQLAALGTDYDRLHTHDREIYWGCRGNMSDSEFFKKVPLDRRLGVVMTVRNRNTFARLAAKYPPR